MRSICTLVLIFIYFGGQRVAAESFSEVVNQTRELRDDLKANFENHLNDVMKASSAEHYGARHFDHLSIRKYLLARAVEGTTRLEVLERDFDHLALRLSREDQAWDEVAVTALAKVSAAQSQVFEAEAILADLATTEASWNQQCGLTALGRTIAVFNPMTFAPLASADVEGPMAPRLNWSLDLSMSADFGENGTHVRPPRADIDFTQAGAVGVIGKAVLMSANPITVWIGAIGLAGYALFKLGTHFTAIHEGADQEGKLNRYRGEIREIRLNAMDRVGRRASAVVQDTCATTFGRDKLIRMPLVDADIYRARSLDVFNRLRVRRHDLIKAHAEFYRRLRTVYLPQLKRDFEAGYHKRFLEAEALRRDISDVIKTRFEGSLRKLGAGQSTWGGKDLLWTELIDADVRFRAADGFSFLTSVGLAGGVETFWDAFSRRVIGAMK